MDDAKAIQDLVRHGILQGYSREYIFNQACEIFLGLQCKIALYLISEWFPRHANDYVLPEGFRPIIETIRREFKLSKHGAEGIRCSTFWGNHCFLQMLTERYALEIDSGSNVLALYVYDLWLGQKRKIRFDGEIPNCNFNRNCQIIVLDTNYFLIKHCLYRNSPFATWEVVIFLARLNLSELKCTVLDTQKLDGLYEGCIVDYNDQHKFALSVSCRENYFIHRGCVVNEKLCFDEKLLPSSYSGFSRMQYSDDKIYCLHYNYERERNSDKNLCTYSFSELTLGSDDVQFRNVGNICLEAGFEKSFYLSDCRAFWAKNVCYLMMHRGHSDIKSIYKFDLKSLTGRRLQSKKISGTITRFFVEDEVLTYYLIYSKNSFHDWKKMSLSENGPEKLFHLALKAIRDHTFFMRTRERFKFLAKLPVKFRPFER